MDVCDHNSKCVEEIAIPHEECLKPCEGLYVDVKKTQVEVVQIPQYQLLFDEYKKYAHGNTTEADNEMIQSNIYLFGSQIYFHFKVCNTHCNWSLWGSISIAQLLTE